MAVLEAKERTVVDLTKSTPSTWAQKVNDLVKAAKSQNSLKSKVAALQQQLKAEMTARKEAESQLKKTRDLLVKKQSDSEGHRGQVYGDPCQTARKAGCNYCG